MFLVVAARFLHHAILSGITPLSITGSRARAKKAPLSGSSSSQQRCKHRVEHPQRALPPSPHSPEASSMARGIQQAALSVRRSPRLQAAPVRDGNRSRQQDDVVPSIPPFYDDESDKQIHGETHYTSREEDPNANAETEVPNPPAPELDDDNIEVLSLPAPELDDDLSIPRPSTPSQDRDSGYESDSAISDVSEIPSSSPFRERVMRLMNQNYISHKNREAVEIAVIAMAGSNTVEHERGDANQRNAIMYEQYIALVDLFEPDDFENVHDNLQEIMKDRLKHAQGQVTGEKLWNKYTSIRKELRLMHTRIKTNPRDIPSGKQLMDMYMDWLLTHFKELGVRLMFLFI